MTEPTSYHQIGRFIVAFQHVEDGINNIIGLLAKADQEMIRILINELDYSERLKTVDVLLARFLDVRAGSYDEEKRDFHKFIAELAKLGERRNDLVHSKYTSWRNIEGKEGLLRENSKLRGKKGVREETEEKLLPETFNADLESLDQALQKLEAFRIKIINWLYPDG